MAPPPETPDTTPKPGRARRLLWVLVGVPAAAACVLIAASIVTELVANRPHHGQAPVLTPDEIASCRRDVGALLEQLVREAAREQVAPLDRGRPGEALGREWDAFGATWDDAWRAVEGRCRFSQLAERGLGADYDRAAWVHRSLPRTKLKYGHQLARFERDLADEVADMQRALEDTKHE